MDRKLGFLKQNRAGNLRVSEGTQISFICYFSTNFFTEYSHPLRQLVLCFDPLSLASVMERMIRDHRSTRSGLPDLTTWSPGVREVRMIEVKGPGDKLSTKQILWIQFLNSVGIPTQVCHVLSQGSKSLSRPIGDIASQKTTQLQPEEEKNSRKERVSRQKPRKRKVKNDSEDSQDFIE